MNRGDAPSRLARRLNLHAHGNVQPATIQLGANPPRRCHPRAKATGHSIGAIARAIGRPKSTISRELSRNRLPSGRYSPLHAAGAYQFRRRREALIEGDRALRTFVVKGGAPNKLAPDSRQGSSPSSPSPCLDVANPGSDAARRKPPRSAKYIFQPVHASTE